MPPTLGEIKNILDTHPDSRDFIEREWLELFGINGGHYSDKDLSAGILDQQVKKIFQEENLSVNHHRLFEVANDLQLTSHPFRLLTAGLLESRYLSHRQIARKYLPMYFSKINDPYLKEKLLKDILEDDGVFSNFHFLDTFLVGDFSPALPFRFQSLIQERLHEVKTVDEPGELAKAQSLLSTIDAAVKNSFGLSKPPEEISWSNYTYRLSKSIQVTRDRLDLGQR